MPQQIEERVQRLIDWLVEKDLRQWQQVMTYLQRRQAHYAEQIVGRRRNAAGRAPPRAHRIGGQDRADHRRDVRPQPGSQRTGGATSKRPWPRSPSSKRARSGWARWSRSPSPRLPLDITGILAAGVLAIVGFFVIPYKRKQAKERFKEKMETLRDKLLAALTTQFNHEAENDVTRMKEGVAPYTRFVRGERERVEKAQSQLDSLRQRVSAFKARVQAM